MKLFVSYARVDKPLCKQVVGYLENAHNVWYDRRLHAGQEWWEEIQERLDWCEGFVYLLSPESVASEYCQKEHTIAISSGKHIFPVLIQARTAIPKSMSHIHYADLSEGMEDIVTLLDALTVAERRRYTQRSKPAAKTPKAAPVAPKEIKPSAAIADAADAIEHENFDKAVFVLKQALEKKATGRVKRILSAMLNEAEKALEQQSYLREAQREYASILELVKRHATLEMGCEEFANFFADFPDYDPENVAAICEELQKEVSESSAPSLSGYPYQEDDDYCDDEDESYIDYDAMPASPKSQTPPSKLPSEGGLGGGTFQPAQTFDGKKNSDWTPIIETFEIKGISFEMCLVPVGSFMMGEGGKAHSQMIKYPYWIGLHPVSNTQWRKAVENSNGVVKIPEIADWYNDKSKVNHPVVGVTWYQCHDFMQWLGAEWSLPTELQWEFAARGVENLIYPFGNIFQPDLVIYGKNSNGSTAVVGGRPNGASWIGAQDMSGNVLEWTSSLHTAYPYKAEEEFKDMNSSNVRVLRGGSWLLNSTLLISADRYWNYPTVRGFNAGLRCSRSYS